METSEIRARATAIFDHWYDYAVAHDYTRSSAYRLKAAYQHAIAERVLELLCVADQARHRGADEDARAARREAETLSNVWLWSGWPWRRTRARHLPRFFSIVAI